MPNKVQNNSYVERATFVAVVFMFLITVALNYSNVQVKGKTEFLVVHVTVPSEEVGSDIASVLPKESLPHVSILFLVSRVSIAGKGR